ncbi:hypothetical protein DFH09DRAFT_1086765 [Mycena vulgaris]|nr:hypothetical protein DFH09DRAFT_1086765 [Mycena vulgaris]
MYLFIGNFINLWDRVDRIIDLVFRIQKDTDVSGSVDASIEAKTHRLLEEASGWVMQLTGSWKKPPNGSSGESHHSGQQRLTIWWKENPDGSRSTHQSRRKLTNWWKRNPDESGSETHQPRRKLTSCLKKNPDESGSETH